MLKTYLDPTFYKLTSVPGWISQKMITTLNIMVALFLWGQFLSFTLDIFRKSKAVVLNHRAVAHCQALASLLLNLQQPADPLTAHSVSQFSQPPIVAHCAP